MLCIFRAAALLLVIVSVKVASAAAPAPTEAFTNSLGMEFKLIPAGEFMMGSSESPDELADVFPHTSPKSFEDERPQHEVRITTSFYLGVTEVTQAQYRAVMGINPSQFKGETHPVETVSWQEAVAFCERLSAKEGHTYRLPTEAEWEYACRAGTATRYCFGDDAVSQREDEEEEDGKVQEGKQAEEPPDDAETLADYAWYEGNSEMKTHAVAEKKPNAWGLYDMHGNVWEWCRDWYGKDYYANSPEEDPAGPETGGGRVGRGGSWCAATWGCRSSLRSKSEPPVQLAHLGFRVVAVLPAEPRILDNRDHGDN